MNNLFLIASPFQLLCAYEAMETQSKEDTNQLIIFESNNVFQNKMLKDMLTTLEMKCKCDILLYKNKASMFIEKLFLLRSIKEIHYNNVFVGHLEEFFNQVYICNLNYKSLFNLDDGAATINMIKKYSLENLELNVFRDNYSADTIIKKLILKLFGLNFYRKGFNIKWFTIFDLSSESPNIIIKNKFENLIKKFSKSSYESNQEEKDKTFFLGSNVINAGVINNVKEYKTLLRKYFIKCGNKDIVYLAHRFEDIEVLKDLFLEYDVTVLKNDKIVELYFLENSIYPISITSFYSTALFSLKLLFPESNVNFIKIPYHIVNDQFKSNVDNVQEYYSLYFDSL